MSGPIDGYLYVALAENIPAHVKIGYSKNPRERAKFLSSGPRNPHRARIATTVRTEDARKTEARAHGILRDRRRFGEWFEATPNEGAWAILSAVRGDVREYRASRGRMKPISLPFPAFLGRHYVEDTGDLSRRLRVDLQYCPWPLERILKDYERWRADAFQEGLNIVATCSMTNAMTPEQIQRFIDRLHELGAEYVPWVDDE